MFERFFLFRPFFEMPGGGGGGVSAPPSVPAAGPTPEATPAAPGESGSQLPTQTSQTPPVQPAGAPTLEPDLPANVQEGIDRRVQAQLAKQQSEMRAQLDAERAKMQAELQAERTRLQPPPKMPVLSDDQYAWDDAAEEQRVNEQLQTLMYENPVKFAAESQRILAEHTAKREAKIQQGWTDYTKYMRETQSDFEALRPQMLEVLKRFPFLEERNNPASLERVYQIAKGMAEISAPPNPQTLLSDPAFMAQAQAKLTADPAFMEQMRESLRAQIIEEYTTGKRQQISTVPPVMGGGAGGSPPVMPPASPKSWAQARQSALARGGS